MKSFKFMLGIISIVIGLIMFICVEDNMWSKIGLLFLVSGIVDLALCMFSAKYTSESIQDVNQMLVNCPSCGIRLNYDTRICPKCKSRVKGN